jgi:hypothetical protein
MTFAVEDYNYIAKRLRELTEIPEPSSETFEEDLEDQLELLGYLAEGI